MFLLVSNIYFLVFHCDCNQGVIWSLIKAMGTNLFEGKSLLNVSLPVTLFEPRSFLESITEIWSFLPQTIGKLAESQERRKSEQGAIRGPKPPVSASPVERMKATITFVLAGLHRTAQQKKPFNPILGETWQAKYYDGTEVFMEQTSHHPPISHFEVIGPNNSFALHGWGTWNASFRGNSLKGGNPGPSTIEFPDGQKISWLLPDVWIKGVLWGQRQMEYHGVLKFNDEKHGLSCDVVFNPEPVGFLMGLLGYSAKHPIDYYRGELKHGNRVVSVIDGSWLTHVNIDNVKVFDFKNENPALPVPIDNPLPSDCRFRRDLNLLKCGDVDKAQIAKVEMEDEQRRDAKLRKHH